MLDEAAEIGDEQGIPNSETDGSGRGPLQSRGECGNSREEFDAKLGGGI